MRPAQIRLLSLAPGHEGGDIDAPPNVEVVESALHAAVTQHAAAVICHAGHGTTLKAFAHGIPLVCMPISRDQPDTAARVAASGAGIRLRASARPAAIARAVDRVLNYSEYRASAERLAEAIAEDVREDRAVSRLEDAAARARASGSPERRPA